MLKALIFDFDGLILDTESPEFLTWQSIYQEHGFDLPEDEWKKTIGGYGISNFDPAEHLSSISQGSIQAHKTREKSRREIDSLIHAKPILPGILRMILEAKQHGLQLAIGSSSMHSWVDTHAKRIGIYDYFDHIICADDVSAGRTKPHPDIYLKALGLLGVQDNEAVVFEDSLNGVTAARRAGVFVVGIPNLLTTQMGVRGDLTVSSLEELSLKDLVDIFDQKQ